VPGIHALIERKVKDVDGRDNKPGHDDGESHHPRRSL
jgi:hypothetical protein